MDTSTDTSVDTEGKVTTPVHSSTVHVTQLSEKRSMANLEASTPTAMNSSGGTFVHPRARVHGQSLDDGRVHGRP